jgi:hypothetical protein
MKPIHNFSKTISNNERTPIRYIDYNGNNIPIHILHNKTDLSSRFWITTGRGWSYIHSHTSNVVTGVIDWNTDTIHFYLIKAGSGGDISGKHFDYIYCFDRSEVEDYQTFVAMISYVMSVNDMIKDMMCK